MAIYTYTMQVTDFSGSPFPGAVPRARIRPTRDASGPDGMLSSRDIPVALNGAGIGSLPLVATVHTAPPTTYRLVVDWLTTTQDGQEIVGWASEWEFTAADGGGDIKSMGAAPPEMVAWQENEPNPWPVGLVWVQPSTGEVKRRSR